MNTRNALYLFLALALSLGNASAAAVATQFVGWTDGADGAVTGAEVGFDVTNPNSIIVATIYVDNAPDAYNLTDIRFGDGTGIGNGDVAPSFTATPDGRMHSFLFINPSTASGLSFQLGINTSSGIAAILYEVSGANTSLASITSVSGNSITTSTADELIVSFGGNNGTTDPAVHASSIFTGTDELLGNTGDLITGGGQLASASATATSIGSNNITWNLAGSAQSPGTIAYAFQAVPEASTALLIFFAGSALLLRRRRA